MEAVPDALVDVELERRVLGGLFYDPEVILPLRRVLLADDWSDPRHQVVYEVCLMLLDQKVRPSLDNVVMALRDEGGLPRAGGVDYSAGLKEAFRGNSAVDVPVWGERLAALADRRALYRLGGAVQQKAQDMGVGEDALWAEVVSLVIQGKRRSVEGFKPLGAAVQRVMEMIGGWLRGEKLRAVTTGLKSLDHALGGGLPKGQLTLLAGRPGACKTLLSEHFASAVEEVGGLVAFASLEMSADDLVIRTICREAKVDSLALRRGDFVEDDDVEYRLKRAAEKVMGRQRTLIKDQSLQRVADMHYDAALLTLERGQLDLHIVDYVELIGDVEEAREGRHVGVFTAIRRLKALAKSLDCAEVVLSQMSRAGARKPVLSAIKWAGEDIADLVLFPWWPWNIEQQEGITIETQYSNQREDFYILIRKFRHGETGIVPLRIDPSLGVISDPEHVL